MKTPRIPLVIVLLTVACTGVEAPFLLTVGRSFGLLHCGGEAKRLASRLRFLLGFLLQSQDPLTFKALRGSHRTAVHQHATLLLCPFTNGVPLRQPVVPQLVGDNP